MSERMVGIRYAGGAYILWGILPIYWGWLADVSPLEVLAHRTVWSAVTIGALLLWSGRMSRFLSSLHSMRELWSYVAAAISIGVNWGVYVWAVQAGYVLESSLGYFIAPLMNVVCGMLFFGERLRPLARIAVLLATVSVAYLAFQSGRIPWVALALAISFTAYGALRKRQRIDPLEGLFFESLLLSLAAVPYLVWTGVSASGSFLSGSLSIDLLLLLSGIVTAYPLFLFVKGAKLLPMNTLGMLQYLSPTLQFAVALWWFGEPFSATKLIAFAGIWAALVVYAADSARAAHVRNVPGRAERLAPLPAAARDQRDQLRAGNYSER